MLPRWGESGLWMIREIVLSRPTENRIKIALKVLTCIGDNVKLPGYQYGIFNLDDDMPEQVYAREWPNDPCELAKQVLREIILSLSMDDLLAPVGLVIRDFTPSYLSDTIGVLISTLSLKWLRFGPPTLMKYQEMLVTQPRSEPAFQAFFVEHPQFLDPMAVQVWSQPDFHGALEPDFVIRRADDSYLIVEIECPSKMIITKGNQLSRDALHAENQATAYATFLSERLLEARSHFPHFRDPDCLAIIGMEGSLNPTQMLALRRTNASRHKLRTVGFDWLAERAQTILSNINEGEIEVIRKERVI